MEKGFTLIELLVVLLFLALAFVVIGVKGTISLIFIIVVFLFCLPAAKSIARRWRSHKNAHVR